MKTVGAVVDEGEIARLDDAGLARHRGDGEEEARDLGRVGFRAELVHRPVASLGDHQNMHLRLRPDVVEGERIVVLVDLLAGNFAAQDPGEDVVVVVDHSASLAAIRMRTHARSEEHTSELQSLMRISYAV